MGDNDGILRPFGENAASSVADYIDSSSSSGGQSFPVSVPKRDSIGSKVPLERIIRPFATVETKMPDPPVREIEFFLEGQDGEAALLWGGPSDFSVAPAIEDAQADGLALKASVPMGGVPNTSKPNQTQPSKPQDDKLGTISFTMMDAEAEKGKIYNPDDKEQWVEMLRLKSIRFRGSLPVAQVQQSQRNRRRGTSGGPTGEANNPEQTNPQTKYRMEKVILKFNFKWPKWPAEPTS